jgi:uncharacterized protein (TIGR02391 family)
MRELYTAIPNAEVMLEMAPEELGAKLLFLARKRLERDKEAYVHPGNSLNELSSPGAGGFRYPQQFQKEVLLAVTEAWAWLEAQGLLVPAPDVNGRNGFRVLSRRARSFENEAELAPLAAAKLLPKELLNQRVAKHAWLPFMRGEYDTAVFLAMKQVEIALREATRLGGDLPAVQLARRAFHEKDGMLTDPDAEASEQQAMAHLFAGALGVLKNPHSHRNVEVEGPAEAAALIMFASYLVRVVDQRETAFIVG